MAVEERGQRAGAHGGARRRSSPRKKRGRRWGRDAKVLLLITLVCAVTALGVSVITSTSMEAIFNLILYRTTEPYMSPQRQEEIGEDFRERLKKEFGGDLEQLKRRFR